MSGWFVRPRPYFDPDSGDESTLFEVRCPTPETWPNGAAWRGTGAWGDDYPVARYGDEEAAQYHARNKRKPPGYG